MHPKQAIFLRLPENFAQHWFTGWSLRDVLHWSALIQNSTPFCFPLIKYLETPEQHQVSSHVIKTRISDTKYQRWTALSQRWLYFKQLWAAVTFLDSEGSVVLSFGFFWNVSSYLFVEIENFEYSNYKAIRGQPNNYQLFNIPSGQDYRTFFSVSK